MKACLSFKHWMVIFGSAISIAVLMPSAAVASAPLCRSVLKTPPAQEAQERTLNDLAKLKLEVDQILIQGLSTPQRLLHKEYLKKKAEVLKELNLTEAELVQLLAPKIIKLQNKEFETRAVEAENRKSQNQPWNEVRSIPRDITFTRYISPESQLAFSFSGDFKSGTMYDLVTGNRSPLPDHGRLAHLEIADRNDSVLFCYDSPNDPWIRLNLKTRQFEDFAIARSENIPFLSIASRVLSPDHKQLLFHSTDNSIFSYHIIDTATGKQIHSGKTKIQFEDVQDVEFLPNGTILIYGKFYGTLLNPKSKKKVVLRESFVSGTSLISPDSRYLLMSYDKELVRIDLKTGENKSRALPPQVSASFILGNEIWLSSDLGKVRDNFPDRIALDTLEALPGSSLKAQVLKGHFHLLNESEMLIDGSTNSNEFNNGIYDLKDLESPIFTFNDKYGSGINIRAMHISKDGKRIIIQSEKDHTPQGERMFDIWERK